MSKSKNDIADINVDNKPNEDNELVANLNGKKYKFAVPSFTVYSTNKLFYAKDVLEDVKILEELLSIPNQDVLVEIN
jgi:hypothetical protein